MVATPLISIPEAPAPEGAQAEWCEGAGGVRLRAALFPPPGPARGTVVLSPGRSEPIEKYFEVVGDLSRRGFHVLAHDWRGQGLSERLLPETLKGHADGADLYVEDHRLLLDAYADRLPGPLIALSHSMGACLTLLALARGEARLQAAMLSAPMIAVATGQLPPGLARAICKVMMAMGRSGDYVGAASDPHADTFAAGILTHDRARYDRFKAQLRACPGLAVGGLTWGWLDFAFRAEAEILAPGGMERIAVPVTAAICGADRLVLNPPIRTAVGRIPQGRCVEIPGAYHEVLMETDDLRAEFWQAFDDLADRVAPATSPRA